MEEITLEQVIDHYRNRPYMSGIDRDRARVKATGEVFTPVETVIKNLNKMDQKLFADPEQEFWDPTVGDGAFLTEVVIKKMENGIPFEQALKKCLGTDLLKDNCDLCKERLVVGQEHLRPIVNRNIINCDIFKFSGRFDGSPADIFTALFSDEQKSQ